MIAQDNRDSILRENNVIVSGLPNSDEYKSRFQPFKNNPNAPGLLQVSLNPADKTSESLLPSLISRLRWSLHT